MSHPSSPDLEALQPSEEGKSLRPNIDNSNNNNNTEYSIPTSKKFAYLSVYFMCNVLLTIYNKAVLGKFSYPWLLTTIHAGSGSIGCYILLLNGTFTLTSLSRRENVILVMFSFLFTINIAISNVSLAMVSMPFHQILRSTTPIFTILIYRLRYNRSYPMKTYLSLIPLVVGVGFATYGDYYFTLVGFVLTLLGVILASVKTVVTNRIMTGSLALSPLEVLLRMSPLAFMQALFYSYVSGELASLNISFAPNSLPIVLPNRGQTLALVGNGLLAFLLNIASFSANKNAGALTMTVCGNVKQCLTVMLGIMVFGVKVGLLNGFGMAVTLAGAAWYSVVELRMKAAR
ncbi:hypothetical protein B7494_g7931 [Chlorociboria aeruginascens]|nr:hypothetical protein B7494_g7931 [Chlorociboria aeruginascens]